MKLNYVITHFKNLIGNIFFNKLYIGIRTWIEPVTAVYRLYLFECTKGHITLYEIYMCTDSSKFPRS